MNAIKNESKSGQFDLGMHEANIDLKPDCKRNKIIKVFYSQIIFTY